MRVVGAYRRSNSSPFPRYDEDALDERRLVLQSSILARGGVVAKDFTEEFGFARELEFDGLRRAREDVAEDCFFDCGGAISRREREIEDVFRNELHGRTHHQYLRASSMCRYSFSSPRRAR